MRLSALSATQLGIDALSTAGVPIDAARIQTDVLVEAELRGRPSHGLLRLPLLISRISGGIANPRTAGRHSWIADGFLEVAGEQGLGPVVAVAALEAIAERARRTGIACAAISASNHLGMLAWYVEKIAQGGQLAIALTTTEALVHPWGGRQAMLGSNPIAIGVPAQPWPFVFDMATSTISMGEVHDHANRQSALEPGCAVDVNGDATTDPIAAMAGAISPFGGAKGYGLGLSVEALIGSLTAGALGSDVVGTLDEVHQSTKGDVFIVIQLPSSGSNHGLSDYLESVRSSPPQTPGIPVVVPGDRARERRAKSLENGITIPDDIWTALRLLPVAGHDLPPG